MISKARKGYKALAFALLVFTTGIALSGYKIHLEYGRITKKFLPSLWTAAQAEIELLRFLDSLHIYIREDSTADSDQLVKRLYILWSRIPLLLHGSESVHVRAVEQSIATISQLDQTLAAPEPDILSLRKGDYTKYYRIHTALEQYLVPLHKITASTMLKDEEVAEAQREDIRHLYWELSGYFVAIILSAIVLVALLFKEFNKASGLLRVAHEAEATASAAKAQLTAVIDAVPARISARDARGAYIFRNKYSVDWGRDAGTRRNVTGPAESELDRRVFETGELVPLFEQDEIDEQRGLLTWLTTLVPLKEAGGQTSGVVTVSLDISQQKEAQRLSALLATAVQHAGDAIEITDAQFCLQYVNPAFEKASGYTSSDALGKTPFSLPMRDELEEAQYLEFKRSIAAGEGWQGTLRGRRKDGSVYQQEATISPVRNAEGQITHYVAVKRDITERLQTEARIWHLAHHDALTDLPNRVLFQDRLQQAIAHARRNDSLVAIHFVDLDDFKDVNDSLGHELGDLLLKGVALRLRACTRESDTVARLGGDEFAVIQSGLDSSEGAATLAEKILNGLSEPFVLESHEVHVSASIGITIFPHDHQEPLNLVKNADMAMYRAKMTGRANYQYYEHDMNLAFQTRKALERDLRKAIANNELTLFYQPQIDARRNMIIGAEALLRWTHPQRGNIPPAEFIRIAEESALIVPLGEWVLRTACMQNKAWQEAGLPPIRVAVNLSAVQFLYRDLIGIVVQSLNESGLSPRQLELEITEGVLMRDTDATMTTLRRLTQLGIRIAVDDFGTGYSSMAYLKRFPVTKIKIDKAFVAEVTSDRGDAAIVNAVINLAHGLGLSVAAEGVERLGQADYLRARGCDELQGYYFGRPMPAAEFEQRLRQIAERRSAIPADGGARIDRPVLASATD
jgi:diguanylate cyclase (GGDEF)-like protein/PAS domain S-box-containing protein